VSRCRGYQLHPQSVAALLSVWMLVFMATSTTAADAVRDPDDPYLWLEEVADDRVLDWVRARNAEAVQLLAGTAGFSRLESRLLSILDSQERIPLISQIGERFYNFWRDAAHPKGLWRRTTLESYRSSTPTWETVLDLDALADAEGEAWVWHGARVLRPTDRRCLISLSRSGADADVVREFDLETRQFVTDGFGLPEAKSRVAWRDEDSLFVATDFGPGSLTDSGYPRTIRQWSRGQPLAAAEIVFEGEPTDMSVTAWRDLTPGFERDFVLRQKTFYTSEFFLRREGSLVQIAKPDDAVAAVHREWLLIELRSRWEIPETGRSFPAGALLVADFERFLAGDRVVEPIFLPTERSSLAGFDTTRTAILLTILDNVSHRVVAVRQVGDGWQQIPLCGPQAMQEGAADADADSSVYGTASVSAVDSFKGDDYFLITTSPLRPATLSLGNVGDKPTVMTLKESPRFFDTAGLSVSRHEVTSLDGTRVPYFQIGPENLPLDGSTPTLLYGYGGFEIPLVPGYDPLVGAAWLEQGRVYVIANIRGGGEFGPQWHQAALKANRPRAYEDFIAVAKDLMSRGVTKPAHLGIRGGSNGGLLVGNMYTMRPELFGAVFCQVPLLDMRRFHRLLAGASWMGEYGNPDLPEDWAFIRAFSPYHNLDRAMSYPPILITTSTRDDRVHPAHARKMAARLREYGKRVLSYENVEGGHGGAADNRQKAFMEALGYSFLSRELTR
jgi:prolyl oligopeptidase